MVGRRDKQTSHQVVHDEAQHNPGGKFRRKLSNGLAFISLTQRKQAPARQLSSNASLATSAFNTNDSSTAILNNDALLSPHTEPIPVKTSRISTTPSLEDLHTGTICQSPTQLPRPRTFSHIPRPVKIDGETVSVGANDKSGNLFPDTAMTNPKPRPPTRIPTPSPPQSQRRVSSPRQYLSSHPPLQTRTDTNCQPFADAAHDSPSNAMVRSQTTPNLAKATSTPRSANNTTPRAQGLKRPFASSVPQKPVLAENIPTGKRVAQRRSQVQNGSVKRESMAIPSAASNRSSFAPSAPLIVQNKHISLAPPVSTKRLSSRFPHKPVIAKRASTLEAQATARYTEANSLFEEEVVARHQSNNSGGSLTLTLSTAELIDHSLLLPPSCGVENDTQRRKLGTSSGLGGNWRSSKVFAAANHQVRKRFPRSSTFQHLGRPEAPPVPPIPNQYKSPSSSNSPRSVQPFSTSISFSNWHHRIPLASGNIGSSSRSLLSDIATAQISTEVASLKSVSTLTSMDVPESAERPEIEIRLGTATKIPHVIQETSPLAQGTSVITYDTTAPEDSSNALLTRPVNPSEPVLQRTSRSISTSKAGGPATELQPKRNWPISDVSHSDNADSSTYLQVEDYMPPLYWAGRFQSRFDQWRTEAMVAKLNQETRSENEGPLAQCSLDEEKNATMIILMQLRDLCTSAQAADSLHVRPVSSLHLPHDSSTQVANCRQEFEYSYRKDHKMLDTRFDFPPSLRKPEESTPRGPIGRAVRKLTPRKASFASLLKGKGWNRNDTAKATDVAGHFRELQDITDLTTSFEAADSDSFDSSTRLHAF